MSRYTTWLGMTTLVSGCYLSPEVHDTQVGQLDAGEPDAIRIDGQVPPSNEPGDASASDAALDGMDAGCTSDLACPASVPVCSAGSCVACTQQAQCSRFASTPACGSAGACVPCVSDNKARCTAEQPACDPVANQCVQCVSNPDCTSKMAAACKPDRTCGLCTADADCARFGEVCDTRVGACVQCRPDTEEADCRSDKSCDPTTADCAGTACDPKTYTCTSKVRGSVLTCQACVSDSECAASHRCINTVFGTEQRSLGGFCLKLTSSGCAQPYGLPLSRPSLSGASVQTYCGFSEARTSCDAIRALVDVKSCTDDNSCAASGALCKNVNFIANKCSFHCAGNLDCPAELPCGGPSSDKYCGGPTQ